MLSQRPERALRRLVADLSQAQAEDVAAVLAQLDPSQRHKVEALLAAYRGGATVTPIQTVAHAPAGPEPETPEIFEGVSPWLAARLGERRALRLAEAGLDHAMTAPAVAALRAVAGEVGPQASAPLVTPIETLRKPVRRDRLHHLLLGRRGQP